jgi:hypothetical protein
LSNIARFAAYAAEFEKAFDSDDWTRLEPFFSKDAVYEIGLPMLGAERCEGRAALLEWFPDVLNRFDRRFESRELALLDGPKELDGGDVWIRGSATYRAEGIPDLVLILEETVRFEGEQIVHLEDRYTAEMAEEVARFAQKYASRLGIEFTPR